MSSRRLRRCLALAAVALVALGLSACGGGTDEPTSTATDTTASTGDAGRGEAIWASAGCGGCHTLSAAGSDGTVGPDLDELRPDFETIRAQVTDGGGGMPAFADSLSEQEITDVAAYVVHSTTR